MTIIEVFRIKNKVEHQIIIAKVIKILTNLNIKNRDNIVIIVSELVTNILKYADSGKVKLEIDEEIIKIIAIDNGSGIEDIDLALTEGFTSGKSLGMGLPGIKRLSDDMSIDSSSKGTKIIVKLKVEK